MCISALLSLFGCRNKKNNPLILDGPDMEREVWREFTISASTVTYEPTYSYTVRIDGTSQKGYLDVNYTENGYGERGIELESKTVNALLNLQITEFPDAQSVEGSFIGLSVIDSKGQTLKKSVSSENESEILALIKPYVKENKQEKPEMLDGPDMENTSAWNSFSISRYGDSMADQNFQITVQKSDIGYVVTGEVLGYSETEGIILSKKDCRKIDELKPHLLPDVVKTEEQSETEDVMILDAPSVDIEVGYVDGTLLQKVDENDFSMSIYYIVEPYFIKKSE